MIFTNIQEEEFELVELFGHTVLFTNAYINPYSVPDGFSVYNIRGSDYDPGELLTIEYFVGINHAGTIVSQQPIDLNEYDDGEYREIAGDINFLGEAITFEEFYKFKKEDTNA